MDDAATRRHPADVASAERALVAIHNGAFEHEGHRFEPGVRVRTAELLAGSEVGAVVHKNDKRIGSREIFSPNDLDGGVARTGESWLGISKPPHAGDPPDVVLGRGAFAKHAAILVRGAVGAMRDEMAASAHK
jgi:hypothetical protein